MLTLADILDRSARSPAPGPRGHPLLGSLPRARRDPIALFMDSFRDYGEVVRFRLGPMVAHLISSPAGVNHRAVGDRPDEIAGYEIPARSILFISPYIVHRHPGLW